MEEPKDVSSKINRSFAMYRKLQRQVVEAARAMVETHEGSFFGCEFDDCTFIVLKEALAELDAAEH